MAGRKRKAEQKPQRVPVGGLRDIMTVFNKDLGYRYRWVNDVSENGSRIARFKRGGYEFARSETEDGGYVIGQEAVYSSKQDGSLVRLHVGHDDGGNPIHAYLMRIKEEWYLEDKAAKEAERKEIEEMLTRTGSSQGEDFNQYIPDEGGTSITRGRPKVV